MTAIALHLTLRALDAALARGIYTLDQARGVVWLVGLWVRP